jgi:hypothetical protein
MINWQFFPTSLPCPHHLVEVLNIFEKESIEIDSFTHDELHSNSVLAIIEPGLTEIGYEVETSKKQIDKIKVPVLFGRNGVISKAFEADGWHKGHSTVIEVEAGRAVANNQFLKDLFQASMMESVRYCVIAIRNTYKNSKDFETVCKFMDTMYASDRLRLPLDGILIIGY